MSARLEAALLELSEAIRAEVRAERPTLRHYRTGLGHRWTPIRRIQMCRGLGRYARSRPLCAGQSSGRKRSESVGRVPVGCMRRGCAAMAKSDGQGLCPIHAAERERTRRPNSTARGYGARYRVARQGVLGQPCALALPGCTGIADTADHVTPLILGGTGVDLHACVPPLQLGTRWGSGRGEGPQRANERRGARTPCAGSVRDSCRCLGGIRVSIPGGPRCPLRPVAVREGIRGPSRV